MNVRESAHISSIRVGDVVEHEGQMLTVGNADLKHCQMMGRTLRGDCYRLGYRPVTVIRMATLKTRM